MNTRRDPREIAETILNRSICAVKVGSVIADSWGVGSWGWNSSGFTGLGEHAEAAAIRRGNKQRMKDSTLYVAAVRERNNKIITAKPCDYCQRTIRWAGIRDVWYRDRNGIWRRL